MGIWVLAPLPLHRRGAWEFQAILTGSVQATLRKARNDEEPRSQTLWALPPQHWHGWTGDAPGTHAVFHFSTAPAMLEEHVPARGYYRVPLSDADCDRIRLLAEQTIAEGPHHTALTELKERALLLELSLIALRECPPEPIETRQRDRRRVEQALAWYTEHMEEAPATDDIARAVHVTGGHLRHIFQKTLGESPHQAFTRLRIQRIEELLMQTDLTTEAISEQVGLSSAAALSHAVKKHFGQSPRQLRGRDLRRTRT